MHEPAKKPRIEIKKRLLCGYQTLFDISMSELIRAGVAIRAEHPLAGSRRHYSLVDGGKAQEQEMPGEKNILLTDIP